MGNNPRIWGVLCMVSGDGGRTQKLTWTKMFILNVPGFNYLKLPFKSIPLLYKHLIIPQVREAQIENLRGEDILTVNPTFQPTWKSSPAPLPSYLCFQFSFRKRRNCQMLAC